MFQSWRGIVGYIKPTYRPGSLEEFIRLLPEGIGVIPLLVGIRRGTEDEFRQSLQIYKDKVAELAACGVDLINMAGAPPKVHGLREEEDMVKELEEKHKVPIITSGRSHVAALKALGIKSFVGVAYLNDSLNQKTARYFTEAGFHVAGIEGIPVAFNDVGKLSPQEIYAHTKRTFLKHPDVDGIFMAGGGWRLLDVARYLEQDLQVPVVYDPATKVWDVQRRLHVRQPIHGYGRLLEELP